MSAIIGDLVAGGVAALGLLLVILILACLCIQPRDPGDWQ